MFDWVLNTPLSSVHVNFRKDFVSMKFWSINLLGARYHIQNPAVFRQRYYYLSLLSLPKPRQSKIRVLLYKLKYAEIKNLNQKPQEKNPNEVCLIEYR